MGFKWVKYSKNRGPWVYWHVRDELTLNEIRSQLITDGYDYEVQDTRPPESVIKSRLDAVREMVDTLIEERNALKAELHMDYTWR